MCLEGKEQKKCKQTGTYQLQCCVCKEIYSQKQWDELAVVAPNATTMGGDSSDEVVAAPAEPPKVKLAQRLAAFVEEKQSLEKAMREAHEAAFADVKWTKSAMRELFVAALADSRGYMIRVPTREVRGWNDGSAQRMFEDAGFAVDSYSGIRTMIDDVDLNGCSVFVIRF